MLPDLSGLDKRFDYAVPPGLQASVAVGSIVRIRLRGRRVRGVVVSLAHGDACDGTAPAPAALLELEGVASIGPAPEVVELARWAAWRYAGRLRPFLVAASPPRLVRSLPVPPSAPVRAASGSPVTAPSGRPVAALAAAVSAALAFPVSVLRFPPALPRLPLLVELAAALGGSDGLLAVVPERRDAERLRRQLERAGMTVALLPDEWDRAAAGGRAVVGSRAAAFGPLPRLRAAVVLDAHDEALTEQRAPTWSAAVVLAERARRAGAPLVLVSPCPSLEISGLGSPVLLERSAERSGWPVAEVIDRRGEDPRSGRYSPLLAPMIARALEASPDLPVVAVLNRTGRTRLLACGTCGEPARCERCGSAVAELAGNGTRRRSQASGGTTGQLSCPVCGEERPQLCAKCGSAALRRLRVGAAGAAEELAALTGVDATTVSGPARDDEPVPARGMLVGTEAVLHRVRRASLVAFLDLDGELLAPRLRAGEQAMALLARAARVLGGRGGTAPAGRPQPGRLVLQTRLPEHEVVRAVVRGDPGLVAAAEAERRRRLRLPPFASLALLEGADAAELGRRLRSAGLEVGGTARGDGPGSPLLVRAPDPASLADALARSESTALDVRVEVDPLGA